MAALSVAGLSQQWFPWFEGVFAGNPKVSLSAQCTVDNADTNRLARIYKLVINDLIESGLKASRSGPVLDPKDMNLEVVVKQDSLPGTGLCILKVRFLVRERVAILRNKKESFAITYESEQQDIVLEPLRLQSETNMLTRLSKDFAIEHLKANRK
jgi:hypothetical protein